MKFPETAIAVGARGKEEARVLESKGKDHVVYGYVDVKTGKKLSKYSILLKSKSSVEHLFIVRLATGKELVVKHEKEKSPEKRGIYDKKSKKVIYF